MTWGFFKTDQSGRQENIGSDRTSRVFVQQTPDPMQNQQLFPADYHPAARMTMRLTSSRYLGRTR